MRDIERFLDRVVEKEDGDGTEVLELSSQPVQHRTQAASPTATDLAEDLEVKANPLKGILRRWYIALLIFLVVAGVGVPGVWMIVEPGYIVSGFIQIDSMQEDPLTGRIDKVNIERLQTHAMTVLSPQLIERVADDLKNRDLDFFSKDYDPVSRLLTKLGFERGNNVKEPAAVLQEAKRAGVITSRAIRDSELIAVTMKSLAPEEAKEVVDSFIKNFKTYASAGDNDKTDETLRGLELEKTNLSEDMKLARSRIREIATEYGNTLSVEQELASRRVAANYERLSGLHARITNLEIQVDILKKHGDANSPVMQNTAGLNQYINEDPMVRELTQNLISIKKDLIIAKQTLNENNPFVVENRNLVSEFESQLGELREELEGRYYEMMREQQSASHASKLAAAELELERLINESKELRAQLDQEKIEKQQVGVAGAEMQDLQFQFSLDKDLYDQVSRRIKQIQMESNMESTITIHSRAAVQSYEDKRIKMSTATVFGGLGLGCLVAFLLDKRDKRLHSPEEMRQHVRNPLLGTISQANLKKETRIADTFIADYQTVRTNLALLIKEGIPKVFAVVSPSSQEGKTTFCINLATSLAGAGKRVLLIDGDLRRPNVMTALGMDLNHHGTHKIVADAGFDYTLYSAPSSDLDVLVPEIRCMADPFELISAPALADRIFQLGTQYDHIIIDTPPVLAFPDAALLAHMAGRALVVTFCGRTFGPELSESVTRLEKAGVLVLGVVMNNVPTDQSYYKYGYGYSYRYGGYAKKDRKQLLAHAAQS